MRLECFFFFFFFGPDVDWDSVLCGKNRGANMAVCQGFFCQLVGSVSWHSLDREHTVEKGRGGRSKEFNLDHNKGQARWKMNNNKKKRSCDGTGYSCVYHYEATF